MPGVVLIIIVLIVVIPVGFLMAMAGLAAGIGWIIKTDVDEEYEGTEYAELGG